MKDKELILRREKFFRSIVEKLNVDVLLENFLGLLVLDENEDLDLKNIHVIPKENKQRTFKNDIISIPAELKDEKDFETEYFHLTPDNQLVIYTSRSSVLDNLPEGIYTDPDNFEEFYLDENEDTWLNEYEGTQKKRKEAYQKKLKEELKSARRFFVPLEIEYNKVRIQRELNEVHATECFEKIITPFWTEGLIEDVKRKRFVTTLHLVPYIIGDKTKTEALIQFVLGTKVSLDFSVEESFEIKPELQNELTGNQQTLGYNMSIGNRIYDYLPICTLTLEELSNEEFYQYFNKKSKEKKLVDDIIHHYFPLDVEVRIDFSIKKEKDLKEEKNGVAILGFSSTLGF